MFIKWWKAVSCSGCVTHEITKGLVYFVVVLIYKKDLKGITKQPRFILMIYFYSHTASFIFLKQNWKIGCLYIILKKTIRRMIYKCCGKKTWTTDDESTKQIILLCFKSIHFLNIQQFTTYSWAMMEILIRI